MKTTDQKTDEANTGWNWLEPPQPDRLASASYAVKKITTHWPQDFLYARIALYEVRHHLQTLAIDGLLSGLRPICFGLKKVQSALEPFATPLKEKADAGLPPNKD